MVLFSRNLGGIVFDNYIVGGCLYRMKTNDNACVVNYRLWYQLRRRENKSSLPFRSKGNARRYTEIRITVGWLGNATRKRKKNKQSYDGKYNTTLCRFVLSVKCFSGEKKYTLVSARSKCKSIMGNNW